MRITLHGLLLHDPDDRDSRRVFTFEGWDHTAEPEPLLVPNGGGDGARPVGHWVNKEKYLTCAGRAATTDRASFLAFRQQLLAALPTNEDVPLVVEEHADLTLQMFVRRFGKVEPSWMNERWTDYVWQAVATDPWKYALTALGGTMGVWAGDRWYRQYVQTGGAGPWFRRYVQDGGTGPWFRRYVQDAPVGLPDSLVLNSPGDATSERVTVEVTGPLTADDWKVVNEATGEEMWASLSLTANQTLTFNSRTRTATLNGGDVTSYMYGDWLTLPPGQSVWRLSVGQASAGFATVTAYPAYE